jgi:hypothetical protein
MLFNPHISVFLSRPLLLVRRCARKSSSLRLLGIPVSSDSKSGDVFFGNS